ncbi:MAG: insulinase family protein [Proteobacteria bacterium]|nr:insulinase family protein [Pseudomonadota bacterium]
MELPESLSPAAFELRNGMTVILCDRPHLHRIFMMLNVSSGCRDENLSGTAHMLEHLIFRGTDAYPSLRALSEAFETRGADFNAFTAREVTSFEIVTPPESLTDVLQLLGAAILHPRLTGIAAEREIVREEILADYDASGELINEEDMLVEAFYGLAGRPIAGNPDDIDKITKEEVLRYYADNYCAERMTLVAVGPIPNKDAFLSDAERAFQDLRHTTHPRTMHPLDEPYASALKNLDLPHTCPPPRLVYKRNDGATQSEISMGYLCDGVRSDEFYTLSMLARVLDDGMASRLSRRLVEELALVYDAEATLSVTDESTLLQIRVSCRHRRVPRLISAVYDLLAEIAQKGIGQDEFDRIRRRVIWEHRALLDGGSSLCSWISSMIAQGMTIEPAQFCNRLVQVEPRDVQQITQKLLASRPHIVTIVGELGEKTLESVRTLIESIH